MVSVIVPAISVNDSGILSFSVSGMRYLCYANTVVTIQTAKLIKFAHLQTVYHMETRVLTLFDDDDFFPGEEPAKKQKKEIPQKEITTKDTVAETADKERTPEGEAPVWTEQSGTPQEVETGSADTISAHREEMPGNGTMEIPGQPHIPEEPESSETTVPVKDPGAPLEEQAGAEPWTAENLIPEPEMIEQPEGEDAAIPEGVALPAGEMPEVNEEAQENDAAARSADEELNKQILSELIQLDYTALIHRDYPFDVNRAEVVTKDRVVRVQEPAPLPGEQEEEPDEVFEEVVPLPEWELDKKYYTIGEVAQLFAVNTSHIRFWTNEFKLKPRTTRKGDRLYTPKDIAELRLIHHLVKEKKHTIKGAREKLKAEKTDVHNKLDLKDSLEHLRDTLLQIRAQL